MPHRSQSTQQQHLMQTKTGKKKYTCGSDWIVLHCVKNDNPWHHLPTSWCSESTTVMNFSAIFLLEEVLPMLLQSPDEPLFIYLPQDYGDLSAGWKCFQKLLISPLGWVERTHGEKRFHTLPHSCQQRSDPGTMFLVWQCAGISIKLLKGRAL